MAEVVGRMEPVGEGWVRGRLYDLGEYPGAVLDEGSERRIPGTVFRLPDDADFLSALDEYEGFEPDCPEASLFVRVVCEVEMATGSSHSCSIYVYRRQVEGLRVLSNWPAKFSE
jgi:gamma-glutamylcyclotransferase (GGCT)/AIG2-like uncharacterized protein YtfP